MKNQTKHGIINVLIVEDNEDDLFFIKKALSSDYYNITVIDSGIDAYKYLQKPEKSPDIVLLDNKLPGMNGLEILREICKETNDYSFIFLTVDNTIATVVEAMKTGALDFIVKSSDLKKELPEKIEKVYEIHKNKVERKRIVNELSAKTKLLETIFENAPYIMMLVDRDLHVTNINRFGVKFIDKNEKDPIGQLAGEVFRCVNSLSEGCGKSELCQFCPVRNCVKLTLETGESVYEEKGQMIIERDDVNIKLDLLISTTYMQINESGQILLTIVNITDRVKMEEELRQSEDNYKRFMDESNLGIRIIDTKGITCYVNKALLDIYGLKSYEEFLATPVSSRYTEQELEQHEKRKEKRKKGEDLSSEYEIEIIRKGSEIRHLQVIRKEIVWDKTLHFQVIYQDITERKRVEEALRESNELLSSFVKHSPIYAFIKDVTPNESRVIMASENYIDMIGVPSSEMLGKTMHELFPPEFAKKITTDDWIVASSGKAIKLDEDLKGRNYTTIKFPIKFGGKSLLAGYTIDITEGKQAEDAIRTTNILLEQTFEQSPIPMVLVSMPGAIIRIANPACLNFLGIEEEPSILNTPLMDIIPSWQDFDLHGNKGITEGQSLARSLKGFKTDGEERYIVRKDGSIRYELVYCSPIFDDKGNIIAGYLIMLDITDRKKYELLLHEKGEEFQQINEELIKTNEELIKAKNKAEESDHLKSAFLQNMSHEIRTPMNAIVGFSNMLDKKELPIEKRNGFISIIKSSSNQLLSIVTDILTISSLDTKQEKLNLTKVSVNSILFDLFAIFKVQFSDKFISIFIKPQLSDYKSNVFTDGTKLTQILTNLITNALKFTEKGFIEVGYEILGETTNTKMRFYVKDTGIGIRPDLHEKIFDRFRQADMSISRKYGGTGLGLSISKGFVELLGGKIWVESKPGEGSVFYFTIPYKPAFDEGIITPPGKQRINPKTIIVAEDEENNYLYIQELLIDMDLKLIYAQNGQEAVEICKTNPDIGLVLMDIKMPILDGHSAAIQIKKFRPNLIIIAQTAYALDVEKERYKDAFDDYITKPINEEELKQKLMKYINK